MTIIQERLALLDSITLGHGSHQNAEQGYCAMELCGYLAGEPWGDQPNCASPVITKLMIGLNDRWNDEHRQLLKPLIPRVIGTRTTDEDELTRRLMMRDWIVHEHSPRLFRRFGQEVLAARFDALPRITTTEEWEAARKVVREVRDEAWRRWRDAWMKLDADAAAAAVADAAAAAVAVAAAAAAADAVADADADADADAAAAAAAAADADAAAAADAVADAVAAAAAAADADVFKKAIAAANEHTDDWDRRAAAYKVLRPFYDERYQAAYGELGPESRQSIIELVERLCEVGRS